MTSVQSPDPVSGSAFRFGHPQPQFARVSPSTDDRQAGRLSFGVVGWLVIHRLGVCVPSGIVSGLMGLAMSVRERSVEVPA